MEIRMATPADEHEICRLWTMLLSFYNKQAVPEVLQRSFRFAMEHPHQVLIFIILIEGMVAGTASLHLGHYSTWNGNWYGHLEDLMVDPQYRGRGLAYNLLSHIIEVARQQDLARVELTALNDNYNAHRLYEKLGFTANSVVYELPLK